MILNWHETYIQRLTDARTALSGIRRGARVFIGSACGEPQLLVKALIDVAPNLADTEIIHFLDLGIAPYTDEKFNENFRHNALFIGSSTLFHLFHCLRIGYFHPCAGSLSPLRRENRCSNIMVRRYGINFNTP